MKLVPVAVVLFAAFSCSDPAAPSAAGSVSFSYTGAGGGSFSASGGAPSFDAPPPTGTSWVAGFVQSGDTHVAGSRPRAGALVDLAILRLARTTPGSASIDGSCNIDFSDSCTGLELLMNFNGNGDTGDFFCRLTSGAIVLAEGSSSRARGSFSGAGDCIDGAGASSAFSVSNGNFDVPLVAPPS